MRGLKSVGFGLCVLAACGEDLPGGNAQPEPYVFDLPDHFPEPRIPDDEPLTQVKGKLGRHLFYDPRLSFNETQSCASCHLQSLAFTDGRRQAIGSTGVVHRRNSMSLTNVAYNSAQTWANPLLQDLEQQALEPLFSEDPVEMGMAGKEDVLMRRLAEDPRYPDWFADSFPEDADPISVANVVRALSAFQRTLISADAPFDRYVQGDTSALSPSAQRGLDLFFGERLECFHCHGSFNFSASVEHSGSVFAEATFQNNGLYDVDGRGAYPPQDQGVTEVTGRPSDMGRFRAPTLRNIMVTGPYMHDGSLETIDDVIDHYARGGTLTPEEPNRGDGANNRFKSDFVDGFELSESERSDLKAFLEALTDPGFLQNPEFSDPFAAVN